jgi:membrane associated rhomboid family serine protease
MSVNRPVWPMVWPWNDGQGIRMHWRDALNSRRFSVCYLLVIALLYALLGFGSHDCLTPSEMTICDFALWPYNLFEAPHIFVVSLFTSMWFHNSPDHILLVTVVVVVFLQTAEVRIGTKRAMVAMFTVQALVALIMTLYLYTGDYLYPADSWYEFGIRERNYMGGSVGLFGVVGVLFSRIKRPIAGALFYFGFEFWNAHIYHGAGMYVVLGHVAAFTLGFILGQYWLRQETKQIETDELN